jgi:hypothetical protein
MQYLAELEQLKTLEPEKLTDTLQLIYERVTGIKLDRKRISSNVNNSVFLARDSPPLYHDIMCIGIKDGEVKVSAVGASSIIEAVDASVLSTVFRAERLKNIIPLL